MKIFIGADHGGFELKKKVMTALEGQGYEVIDEGAHVYDKLDDFPDFGKTVAEGVSKEPADSRGILLCRSGVGMDIVANRFKGVRSVLALSPEHVARARHDEDVNVLSVASDFSSEADVMKIIDAFLHTPFAAEEKYSRRLKKISELE